MFQKAVGVSKYAVCGLLVASLIGTAPARAATYALTELPRLYTGNNSDANFAAVPLSVNNLGWVAGMAAVPKTYIIFTFNVPHAYLWKNGTVSDLGVLSGSGTFGMSAARCINDANYVVGLNMGTPPGVLGGDTVHNHAFLWQASGSLIDLGSMTANPDDLSGAYAINAGSHIVGNWAPSSDPNIQHAFLRWSNGVVTNLGALGGSESFAWDINDSNQVVGKAKDSSGKVHAFIWSPAGGMTDLGFLPGYDASSEALSINASGQILGISTSSSQIAHSFLWKSGTMTDVGTLSGCPSVTAMAINDKGMIVGMAFDPNGQPTPFIWVSGQIYDLNTLVGTSGWTPQTATSISTVGQVVGSGVHSGLPSGYVMRVYALNTSVSPSGTGTVGLSPTGPFYDPNTTVTVTANPAGGSTFNSWSGDLSGPNNPTTIKLTACKSITANFTQGRCTLTLASSPSGAGTITANPLPDPNDGKYAAGTVVTLTANANTGYTFGTWSGDASGSANPTTVTMSGNKSVTANFNALPHYALSLMVIPPGAGTITANPLPGGDGKYVSGTVVTLTAEPNAGYAFSQWSGSISGPNNPTTITMDADKGATAEFATARHTLTLASSPPGAGTITANPLPGGDGKYAYGTVVTLTANPNTGYGFNNWSGDASGSVNPTTVTMTGNKSVTANFAQLRYTLTLASNPPAGGTIDANPAPGGDGKYAYGTVVTLTANANAGYAFGNWSGDASGSSNPTTVTMNGDKSVTANFTELRYTLTLASNPPEGGTIDANPLPGGDGKYAYGTVVTLTANPATGYTFDNWSGDASGSSNPTTVTMNGNKSVTANFSQLRYTLTLASNPVGGGSIDANPPPGGDGKYAYGTVVTLTANAAGGYAFDSWSGDATGSSNPVQVTMTGGKAVTANFTQLRYTLTLVVNPSGTGSIDASPPPEGDGKYAYGTVVTLTANPAVGEAFDHWSGDATGSSNPVQVTMTGDKGVTANFTQLRYTLTLAVNPTGGGSIDASPPPEGDGKYAYGTVVTLTANAGTGYAFSSWSGGASGSDNPTQVTMTGDKGVTANFTQFRYVLTLAVDPNGAGSIDAVPPPEGDGKYPYGTVVTLTANAAGGYSFGSWSGDASGSSNPVQVTMTGNKSVTANFTQLRYTLTLASNPPGGGTIGANPAPDGDGKYAYGTVVTLTANPAPGYSFGSWSGDATGSSNPVQVTMTASKSVTANFSQVRETLTLAVQPPASGSILRNPAPDGDGKYAYGTVVTLTANPAGGYLFGSWSGDASGPNNPTQVTMNSNKNVTANFVHGYTLTLLVSHSNWGAVNVEPNLPVYPQGTNVTLTAVPNSGKSFVGWTIDNPNYPTDDPRYYNAVDPNTLADPLVLPLTMNSNMQVEADFKCGSGMDQILPLLSLMLGASVLVVRASRRRR